MIKESVNGEVLKDYIINLVHEHMPNYHQEYLEEVKDQEFVYYINKLVPQAAKKTYQRKPVKKKKEVKAEVS